MQALGLIETRGLLPAIECLDIMLKSAQVELIEKCNVGGGLVTIAVTGDVGAVQAAVEAGASTAQSLGSDVLISRHVIPRPHNDIELIIGRRSNSPIPVESDEQALPVLHMEAAEQMPEQTPEQGVASEASEIPLDATLDVPIDSGSEEIIPVPEANTDPNVASEEVSPETDNGDPPEDDDSFKHQFDVLVKESGIDKAMELLETMTTVKLRGLARKCGDTFGMSMTTISKANKVKLLKRFRHYYQQ